MYDGAKHLFVGKVRREILPITLLFTNLPLIKKASVKNTSSVSDGDIRSPWSSGCFFNARGPAVELASSTDEVERANHKTRP